LYTARSEPALPPPPNGAKKPLLLIVQADPAGREALVDYLGPQGYRTEVIRSDEVVAKARDLHPDAITLDLLDAGAQAWHSLRELRRVAETARIPVLVVSVLDEEQDIVATGAAAYLVKPIDRELLLRTLQQQVQARPGNPPKILVVDDEPSSLELIQEVLGTAGYLPILNSSGREALETLTKTQVSAVIVDLLIPEMNGFEFIFRVSRPDFRICRCSC